MTSRLFRSQVVATCLAIPFLGCEVSGRDDVTAAPRSAGDGLWAVARASSSAEASGGAATVLGTTTDVLDRIESGGPAELATIQLPLDDSNLVSLVVQSYRRAGVDADLVITGYAKDAPDSAFMLRGDAKTIYGWIHFRSQRRAYEYSTDDNRLVTVQEVPVRRICSSCEGKLPRPPLDVPAEMETSFMTVTATANEPHLGNYPGTDLLTLESRPGAKKVLYLNISPILTNGTPSSATAGNSTAWTKEDIWKVWQAAASGYSAFEVNVTTSPTVFSQTATADVGVANFVAKNDTSVSYQGTFGTGKYQSTIYATKPCETDALGFGRTVIHELGHQLGMLDAGDASNFYYPGNKTYQWYPIMGDYYYGTGANAVVQWSKGEWSGANSAAKIDALASISKYLGYRADDITDSKALVISGTTVSPDSSKGQITGASDTDSFTFQIGSSGGKAALTIDRIEATSGGMLDVLATLKDASGAVLATSNPTAIRSATINQALGEGRYTLVIRGGSEGTASNGFTAYGSIGFYGIEGTITGAVTSDTGGSGGAGGSSGTGGNGGSTGGSTGSGGAGAGGAGGGRNGGSTGGGGTGGRGGVTGIGGSVGSGAAIGTGGVAATGGAGASGGDTGRGGSAGSGDAGTGRSDSGVGRDGATSPQGGQSGSGQGGSSASSSGGAGGQSSGGTGGAAGSGGKGSGTGGSAGSSGSDGKGTGGTTDTTSTSTTGKASSSGCSCRLGAYGSPTASLFAMAIGIAWLLRRTGRRWSRGAGVGVQGEKVLVPDGAEIDRRNRWLDRSRRPGRWWRRLR